MKKNTKNSNIKKDGLKLAVLLTLICIILGIVYVLKQDETKNENLCAAGEYLFKHKQWTDCMIVDNNLIYRKSNHDQASFLTDGEIYLLQWEKWESLEIFICNRYNVCIYQEKNTQN